MTTKKQQLTGLVKCRLKCFCNTFVQGSTVVIFFVRVESSESYLRRIRLPGSLYITQWIERRPRQDKLLLVKSHNSGEIVAQVPTLNPTP